MLDSIREIFDILYFDFESVGFNLIKYKNFDQLVHAVNNGKCLVVDVLKEHYSSEKHGSHVMIATGIKHKDGVECIQLKNSFADNPNEQGRVQTMKFVIYCCILTENRAVTLNFSQMFITCHITKV